MIVVVDASALLETLLRLPAADVTDAWLLDGRHTLHAPHLIDVEIAQVLRRFAARGDIDAARGTEAIADLKALRLRRYPHAMLLDRVWESRNTMTAYDAAYVVLAELLDATLLTRDRRLAAAVGNRVAVEVV